tara:strand:+ start:1088 stop:1309 length:222 start_codon:yes stop_codon:yes gene_type:complete
MHASFVIVSNAAVTIKLFDSLDNSGTEIARMHHSTTGQYNIEFDMHGVLATTALFLEVTEASSSTVNVSVEFN